MPLREWKTRLMAVAVVAAAGFLFRAGTGTAQPEAPPTIEAGRAIYEQYCANCHYDGKGNPAAPDLAGTPYWRAGQPDRIITLLLRGQGGVSVVDGKPFNGQMPPMDFLTDAEIAEISTYSLKAFGNVEQKVDPAAVAQLRKAR